MHSTLVLNASFEPLSIVSAQRAVTLVLNGKASAVDESPRTFRSVNGEINIPYVIQLNEYVKPRDRARPAQFSRRGVLVRDNFKCAYCGGKATTIDHVLPRFLGGKNSYENCVAACTRCNHKKGHKTLESLGWTLPFIPKTPTRYASMLTRVAGNAEVRDSWAQYIGAWDSTVKV